MESSKEIQMDPGSSSSMQIDPEIANFETLIHYGLGPRLHFMSLGHVIQTRYQNGLPEEFIAIIMRDVLRALLYLLVYKSFDHRDLNSRQVFICRNSNFVAINVLAYPDLKHGGPRRPRFTSTKGLWRLGTIALEMAYGSSVMLTYNFISTWPIIVNNVVTVLELILESDKNQTLKEVEMQIATRTLKIADDLELKEKAKEKEKEPMKISDDLELGLEDDPAGKTMAEEKRKEMAKRKGKEQKKLIIKLPPFKNLMNPLYVDQLVDKYNRGKEKQEKKEKLKTMLIFICCQRVKEAKTKFSRDFLEVVLMQATAKEILEHPFFHQPLNVRKFELNMRSIPPQIWGPSEVIP